MPVQVIKWNKKYFEDLGAIDKDGFLDYAYRYFVYSFYFPGNYEVLVRRYTDTSSECSIFLPVSGFKSHGTERMLPEATVISVIANFMNATQGITQFSHFDDGYIPVYLTELKDDLSDFLFVEVTEK